MDKAKFNFYRKVIIYNEAGKEYGNVSIQETEFKKIKKIKSKISEINGNHIRKLNKDDIKTSHYSPGYILHDDLKYKWFEMDLNTFPYIVEYSYEQELKSLFFWCNWYPQEDVPVLQSTYKFIVNNEIKYKTHSIGINAKPQQIKTNYKSQFVFKKSR